MSEDWDEFATHWEEDEQPRIFRDQAFSSLMAHGVLGADARTRARVLDFGCGTGLLSEKLSPLVKEIIAVDTSPEMLGRLKAKAIANVTALCADLDDPATRADAAWLGSLDLIVASSVCGFLPDYEKTVRTLSAALRPGGYFVQWDWLAADGDAEYGLPQARIENALHGAGLEDVTVRQVFSVTFDGEALPVLMGAGRAPSR